MGKLYVSEVLRIAALEVGYKEKASNEMLDDKEANAGSGNWNKYARDLWGADPHYYNGPKNGYDWCTAFADWVYWMACGRDARKAQAAVYYTGPYGGSCTFSVRYYRAANAWYKKPKAGDQIFFGTGYDNVRHTGIVTKVTAEKVYTTEGNSSNQVRNRVYALDDAGILGYGRPAFDGLEPPQPEPQQEPEYPTRFNDVPADTWYTETVIWALDHGLTAGVDDTHFAPDRPMTRAEVYVALRKFAQVFGLTD